MKNHWIQLYEKKKKNIWTAAFSFNAIFLLQPRQVTVVDPKYSLGILGQNRGTVSIIFKDAMFSTGDKELLGFLVDAHRTKMTGYYSLLRKYQGLKEVEQFQLTGLTYNSLTTGVTADDIKFTFDFSQVRHFHVS